VVASMGHVKKVQWLRSLSMRGSAAVQQFLELHCKVALCCTVGCSLSLCSHRLKCLFGLFDSSVHHTVYLRLRSLFGLFDSSLHHTG
jgi:hypothetical protein